MEYLGLLLFLAVLALIVMIVRDAIRNNGARF